MSYQSTALSLSPLALWMFNESSGTTLNDQSGNGQTGTYNSSGVTLGAAGLLNDGSGATAAAFDGSAGYASVPNSSEIATTSFTAVWWMKSNGSQNDNSTLMSMDYSGTIPTGGDSGGWDIYLQGGVGGYAAFRVDTSGHGNQTIGYIAQNGLGAVNDGNAHMVAICITGGNGYYSVDANNWSSALSIAGTYAASPNQVLFAAGLGYYKGTIQAAAIFSGQLSQPNLSTLYTAGTTPAAAAADDPQNLQPIIQQQQWNALRIYEQAKFSDFNSSPLVDVPGEHWQQPIPSLQRVDWNALKVYGAAGYSAWQSSPLVDVPGDHGKPPVPPLQYIDWRALRAYAQAQFSDFNSSPLVDVPGQHHLPPQPPRQRVDWNALQVYAQAGRNAYDLSPLVDVPGQHGVQPYPQRRDWNALQVYAQAGRNAYDFSAFIYIPGQGSVPPYPYQARWDALKVYAEAGRIDWKSSPLVDVPGEHGIQPVQLQVQWNGLRAYAEAGRSAYDFSIPVGPPLLPHNIMINAPHAVQNLTIKVLEVYEGY